MLYNPGKIIQINKVCSIILVRSHEMTCDHNPGMITQNNKVWLFNLGKITGFCWDHGPSCEDLISNIYNKN